MPDTDTDTVTVFHYRVFQATLKKFVLSSHKAPRTVIDALGGEVIEGTAEQVRHGELDAEGVYRRSPTGWGELGLR